MSLCRLPLVLNARLAQRAQRRIAAPAPHASLPGPGPAAAGQLAHFKFTVLLMPNGSDKITGIPAQKVETDKAVESEELKTLLATSTKTKKAKKKAKKAEGDAAAEAEAA